MAVVSVSLSDRNMETIDRLIEVMGLKGRSEAIRACIRSMEDEIKSREGLTGTVEGVLVIVHDSHKAPNLDKMRHDNQAFITTQIHTHLSSEKCLEVFLIKGPAHQINRIINDFKSDPDFHYVRFVPS